jgi:hypothetical protein
MNRAGDRTNDYGGQICAAVPRNFAVEAFLQADRVSR